MTYIDETDFYLFLQGYREAMLWANTLEYGDGDLAGDGAELGDLGPALNASEADINSAALMAAEVECRAFLERIVDEEVLPLSDEGVILWGYHGTSEPHGINAGASMAGHDFALTRNGHGAGFWDRGLGEVGDTLSEMAKSYGEVSWVLEDGVASSL